MKKTGQHLEKEHEVCHDDNDTVQTAVVNLYIQIVYGEHIDAGRKLERS